MRGATVNDYCGNMAKFCMQEVMARTCGGPERNRGRRLRGSRREKELEVPAAVCYHGGSE